MKKYIIGFLRLGTAAALLFVIYSKDTQIKKLSATNKVNIELIENTCDSLKDEIFARDVEVGRYELTLDHLKEVNPKAGTEFENYMSHETE